ncbi:MAG: glycosyltransferase family 39 protein [Saprospiraceae bacterium]|nr:glycosyltransferase family 39 protein [Saprospiraceae bacterium]
MNISNRALFLLLLLLSVVLRIPLLFPSVIDHDESTYVIIADQFLSGRIPYADNLDVKPIGIYLIFSAVLKLSNSIAAIRLFSALIIAISGMLIYSIHFILFSYRRVALVTAFLYVFCATLHKWSWPANTEIFFQLFSLLGLYLLLKARKPLHFISFGLVAGLGFLIKFHIAFSIIAFSIFYFFWQDRRWWPWFRNMTSSFLGFLIPVFILIAWHSGIGYLQQLKFAMLTIPANYASEFNVVRLLSKMSEFYLSFLPVTILTMIGLKTAYSSKWMLLPHWVLFASWTTFSWISIALTGKFFFHYYFQALPALCLFALTWFMMDEHPARSKTKLFLADKVYWILGMLILLTWTNQYLQVLSKPDVSRQIVEVLEKKWEPGDQIYTSDKNILYFLLNTDPPTKYIHTTVLYDKDLIEAYQVDVEKEFQLIVDQRMDYYVVSKQPHAIIERDILENFEIIQKFPGDVKLYGRIVSQY